MPKNLLRNSFIFLCFIVFKCAFAQDNNITINATFNIDSSSVLVSQKIVFKNTSNATLKEIYLNDWNNSYASKHTPLAKRFADEFSSKFLFAKQEEYGFTTITEISENTTKLNYSRLPNQQDILKVELARDLKPNDTLSFNLNYTLKLPSSTFTSYGITETKEIFLKNWYITPAVFDNEWHYYSNKDLDDLYAPKSNITLAATFPLNYKLSTDLDYVNRKQNQDSQTVIFNGENRVGSKVYLNKLPVFKTVQTDFFNIISDFSEKKLTPEEKAIINDGLANFVVSNLGDYPHKNMLISSLEDNKDPIYGLNQLPNFLRPFPDNFHYELKVLKLMLNNYFESVLLTNPREDYWLKDALTTYFMMKYVDEHYPDTKLFGALSKVWGLRWFHAADLNFNDQYNLGYMHMARTNRQQPLTMHKDSLTKFNKNIANKYKGGIGLKYLNNFAEDLNLDDLIKKYISENKLQASNTKSFEKLVKANTSKNVDWFFNDYIKNRNTVDYRIKNIEETQDSVKLTIKNKRNSNVPVPIFSLKDDNVINRQWIENIGEEKTISLPKDDTEKYVLNYDNIVPEENVRNNTKARNGFLGINKPFQFRVLQDAEDPRYNQVFLMPIAEFRNIYDGLTLGARLFNKTLLKKPFIYRITPQYATKSKTITGSTSISHRINLNNNNLYNITYGVSASYNSFAEDLFVKRFTPSISFQFRDKNNLRSNKNQILNARYIFIDSDEDVNNVLETSQAEPSYGVFNVRYRSSDHNLINSKSWFADVQFADKFGKLSFNYFFRKLLNSNQQFNLRLYAGTFLYNNTASDSDYFSFALDRPTNYLFDYNYLGRAEGSGLVSQQLIIAEGGFKSKLEPAFANQWMTTANLGVSIWRYIQAYGDLGLVKNKNTKAKFVYDSGIRLNLVQDYFEIYFPVYSNLGWEIAQPNYDEKIRFIFTIDPHSLFGLFRRKWF